MNERHQDFELLQRFTRRGEQSAFGDIVRRHLDLVFATALRTVEDSSGAEEVAQNVFTALARKAWQFAPEDSLPAWLHRAAILESKSWLRGELGRRRREQAAAELGTTMNTSEDPAAFRALLPLLDDALLSLREKDRTALLLRFYEKQSLREVGAAFGVSEDTAQKRVQGALEKLTEFFKRRGYKTATVAAAVAMLKHTAVTASASLAGVIIGGALPAAPVALTGLAALLARLASLSTAQTAALCVALVAVPVGWQSRARFGANQQVKLERSRLLAAQKAAADTQAYLDRWRAEATNLERAQAQARDAAARAAESAQAFTTWKQNLQARLGAKDYRWDDNSPFVRIPKALLPELSMLVQVAAFSPPGVVHRLSGELLCLTPEEQEAIERVLQRTGKIQRGPVAEVYEQETPLNGRTLAARIFMPDPPGENGPVAEQRFGQMLTELRGILGEERWPVVPPRYRQVDTTVWNRALIPEPPSITATVVSDENGVLQAKWTQVGEATPASYPKAPTPATAVPPKETPAEEQAGQAPAGNIVYSLNVVGFANNSVPLFDFLPDATAARKATATNFYSVIRSTPAVRQRAAEWFEEQAARLAGKDKP